MTLETASRDVYIISFLGDYILKEDLGAQLEHVIIAIIMGLTLAQALELTTECRLVTTASRPFKIVHTNRAWSELTQFKFSEAV